MAKNKKHMRRVPVAVVIDTGTTPPIFALRYRFSMDEAINVPQAKKPDGTFDEDKKTVIRFELEDEDNWKFMGANSFTMKSGTLPSGVFVFTQPKAHILQVEVRNTMAGIFNYTLTAWSSDEAARASFDPVVVNLGIEVMTPPP